MAEKTQKELIQEIHQAIFGVPDTKDKGLIGRVDEINGNHKKLARVVWILVGVVITAASLATGYSWVIGF